MNVKKIQNRPKKRKLIITTSPHLMPWVKTQRRIIKPPSRDGKQLIIKLKLIFDHTKKNIYIQPRIRPKQ